MSEKIKKNWNETQLSAIKQWYESEKGFQELDEINNFPSGTLFQLVNAIPDYRGTRRSIGKWIRTKFPAPAATTVQPKPRRKPRKRMTKKSLPITDQPQIERQLLKELSDARKKIERLEAQQAKDHLHRDFLEMQLDEYRKLVKPSQSKKSHTK